MELYRRIKQRREELGMSQEELASKIGYKSRSTIAKIESGVNDIPQSKIKAFADALNTTPSYLMGWDDKLAQIEHDIEVLDAKVYFHYLLRELISYFGYEVEEDFAKDKDGNTTVLLESKEEAFEVKESDYDNLLNSSFSFIDYGFNKMIKEKNRVKSDFFVENYINNDGKEQKTYTTREDYMPRHLSAAEPQSPYLAAAHNDAELTEEELKLMQQDIDDL